MKSGFSITLYLVAMLSRIFAFNAAGEIDFLRKQSGAYITRLYSAGGTSLFQDLKNWRKRMADETQKPAYIVLNNKMVETIAIERPKNLVELSMISGVGPTKLKKYGRTILDIVQAHQNDSEEHNLEALSEINRVSDSDFWATFVKPKPKKAKKAKPEDVEKATQKRRQRIQMLSDSTALEAKWPDIELTDLNNEQQAGATHILAGNNVFLTGSAGTGKTFLLRYVIQELEKMHGEASVAVTAPTGIAAINIGGQTIHSFAGLGIGEIEQARMINKMMKTAAAVERWNRCKVLIIDEVSMLSKELFELLDGMARRARNSELPFGGIHVIMVGDFMQLPPVVKNRKELSFCFQSPVWENAGFNLPGGTQFLKQVERQKDQDFVKYLNEVRVGVASKQFLRLLDGCLINKKAPPENGIVPTKLYAINKEVDKENTARLAELPGDTVTLSAEDRWRSKPSKASLVPFFRTALNNLIPEEVQLKVGAQVMLTRNRSKGPFGGFLAAQQSSGPSLVNGSRGKVLAFSESVLKPGLMVPIVQFDNGVTTTIGPVEYSYKGPGGDGEILRLQVPLKLAWAATIHKSQGCTLTCAELMLENTFDFGQVYVALSRVKSIEGLWMSKPLRASSIRANPAVLDFYRNSGDPSVAPVAEASPSVSVSVDVKDKPASTSTYQFTKKAAPRAVTYEGAPKVVSVAEDHNGAEKSTSPSKHSSSRSPYVNTATTDAVTSVLDFPNNRAEGSSGTTAAPVTKLETVRVKRVYTYKPRQKA